MTLTDACDRDGGGSTYLAAGPPGSGVSAHSSLMLPAGDVLQQ